MEEERFPRSRHFAVPENCGAAIFPVPRFDARRVFLCFEFIIF